MTMVTMGKLWTCHLAATLTISWELGWLVDELNVTMEAKGCGDRGQFNTRIDSDQQAPDFT
jgi:hypothetical protein